MSSEDVEVGVRIRFEGESKSIGARVAQHAIFSTRFDVLAHTVDTIFAKLRSEFTSLHQGESQQRADAGKSYGIKIAQLERENATLREAVNALWNTNDQLTLEIAALRADKGRLDWLATSSMWLDVPGTESFTPETLRAAIDAARNEGGAS